MQINEEFEKVFREAEQGLPEQRLPEENIVERLRRIDREQQAAIKAAIRTKEAQDLLKIARSGGRTGSTFIGERGESEG